MPSSFTPQQIEEFLQEFFDVVGARQYIGARYVPIFGRAGEDTVEWDDGAPYEPLTVVMHLGVSYVSRRYVPTGIQIDNTDYWVETYRFNAQVEQYRQEVLGFQDGIDAKIPWPVDPASQYGDAGQVLGTLQNGLTEWVDPVVVTSEIAGPLIEEWLDDHPEATTTVLDGSITNAKLADNIFVDSKLNQLDGILPSLAKLNAYEIPYTNRSITTNAGCTFDSRGEYVIVSGTPSAKTFFNLILNYELSPIVPAGSYVWFGATGLVDGLFVGLLAYTDDYHSIEYKYVDGETYVQIPSNATRLLLRVQVNTRFNGNATRIYPYIRTALPQLKTKKEDTLFSSQPVKVDVDLNDVKGNTSFLISSGGTATNMPPTRNAGYLVAFTPDGSNWTLQLFSSINDNTLYSRVCNGSGVWTAWTEQARLANVQTLISAAISNLGDLFKDLGVKDSNIDLNDQTEDGYFLLSGSNNTNTPKQNGMVLCYSPGTNFKWQMFFQINDMSEIFLRRGRVVSGVLTWNEWTSIKGGDTVNINNEFNSYSNTYNVTATPTITSDANYYLQSTGDTTDRTNDIITMLQTNGICNLGKGVFYVSDLVMPEGSTIRGCGYATEVRLGGSGAGFALQMDSDCIVKDVIVRGDDGATNYRNVSTIGNRNGICWVGDYTSSQDESQQPFNGTISDVYIENFNGAGIRMYDTGFGTGNGIQLSNVTIDNCVVGLNIEYWSEYSAFENLKCWHCHWGIINNGGNNIFSNCHLSSNYMGLLMDNSNGDKPNSAHGSMVNCTFNHMSDGASGNAVSLLGQKNGFMFSNCQLFYGGVSVDDCDGIVFTNCNFGGTAINLGIDGGGLVMFSNCAFGLQPTVNKVGTTHVVADNNYTRAGAVVTI